MSSWTRGLVFVLAVFSLLRAKFLLTRGGWHALALTLPPTPKSVAPQEEAQIVASVCFLAARVVPLKTECLERSYMTCSVLRWRGYPSELCVGVRTLPPLQFHAWTEVRAQVVTDWPRLIPEYTVLTRI